MRTLYIRRGLATKLPATCTVLHIKPLLKELIVETVRIRELRSRNRLHCALRDLLKVMIEREHDGVSRTRRDLTRGRRRDAPAVHVAYERRRPGGATKDAVQCELDAIDRMTVGVHMSDQPARSL